VVGIGLIGIVLAIATSRETANLLRCSFLLLRGFHSATVGETVLHRRGYLALDYRYNATVSLLTFAQSWRMIAAAVFSLYIADMWLKYAENHIEKYQSGSLLEVFSVFSGVLFAMGLPWNMKYQAVLAARKVAERA
jgi:hypothetical protein